MSNPATTPSTFSPFSRLPGELRNQIWRYNLPDLGVILYSYRKGCFGHESFRPARAQIPLFFVCREAREIGLAWMHEKGLKLNSIRGNSLPFLCDLLTRCATYSIFQPTTSGLFAMSRRTTTRISQSTRLFFQADVKYIALTEYLFRSDTFDELALRFPRLEVLFVVVDSQVEGRGDNDKSTGRWELQGPYGKALVYKPDKRKFEFEEGKSVCDEDTYKRIEKASHFLTYRVLTGSGYHESISVRPVAAAKK